MASSLRTQISIHPRFTALLEGVSALVFLWSLPRAVSILALSAWFTARALWWLLLVYTMYFPTFLKRIEHWQALILFHGGIVLLYLFTDQPVLRSGLLALSLLGSVVSFWLVPSRSSDLSVVAKPYRRFKMLMGIFGVAGIWVMIKALEIFQALPRTYIIPLVIGGIFATTLISVWGWREYTLSYSRKLLVSVLVMVFVVSEMAYVVLLWPLGYFTSGLLLTWLWYIVWLMLRFFISEEGIDWNRQRWFLLTNAVLIGIFLSLLARWK